MLQGKNATINSRANWNWHHQQQIIFSFKLTQSTDLWHVFDWERWPLLALLLFLSDSGKNNSRPLTWETARFQLRNFINIVNLLLVGPHMYVSIQHVFVLLLFFVDRVESMSMSSIDCMACWTQFECHNLFCEFVVRFVFARMFAVYWIVNVNEDCLWLVNVLFTFVFILLMPWLDVFTAT